MTTEQRLNALDMIIANHDKHLTVLTEIAQQQQASIAQNAARIAQNEARIAQNEARIAQNEAMLKRHDGMLERHEEAMKRLEEMLLEIRREAAMTKRLWTRLAQRYGWLEDEDLA